MLYNLFQEANSFRANKINSKIDFFFILFGITFSINLLFSLLFFSANNHSFSHFPILLVYFWVVTLLLFSGFLLSIIYKKRIYSNILKKYNLTSKEYLSFINITEAILKKDISSDNVYNLILDKALLDSRFYRMQINVKDFFYSEYFLEYIFFMDKLIQQAETLVKFEENIKQKQ